MSERWIGTSWLVCFLRALLLCGTDHIYSTLRYVARNNLLGPNARFRYFSRRTAHFNRFIGTPTITLNTFSSHATRLNSFPRAVHYPPLRTFLPIISEINFLFILVFLLLGFEILLFELILNFYFIFRNKNVWNNIFRMEFSRKFGKQFCMNSWMISVEVSLNEV